MNIRFYKSSTPPTGIEGGSVWMDPSKRSISIYTGTSWQKCTSDVIDISYNESTRVLAITKPDGVIRINIDSGESDTSEDPITQIDLYSVDPLYANYSDIELSQDVSAFSKLDICGVTDTGESVFSSVYDPNNSIVNFSSIIQDSNELIIKSKQYEIRGTTIMAVLNVGGLTSISSQGIHTDSRDYYIGIYKVVGYY